jgi:DNA-binding response OmpR family regulator
MIERNGYHITLVSSGKAAEEELNRKDFDLVITDLNWLLIGGKVPLKKGQALKDREFLKAS